MKKKFVVIGVVGTLALACVAVFYAASSQSREAAGRLQAARDEAKKLGQPTTMGEVPDATVSEDANAAPFLLSASQNLSSNPEAVPDILMEASSRQKCQFDWKSSQRAGYLPGLKLRQCAALLMDQAAADFKSGNDAAGRRRVERALIVARLLQQEPTDDGLRESVMMERDIYERLGTMMVENPANENLMVTVQTVTFYSRPIGALVRSLRKFVASGNEIAQSHEIDGDQKLTWIWKKGDFPADPWGRDAVEARHLEESVSLVQSLLAVTKWPDAMLALATKVELWSKSTQPFDYSLRESVGAIKDLPTIGAENEAARRALFTAAAAFRSKIQNLQFPARSPVIGDMAFDVFTGGPMAYSNPGTGFMLHSAGADGQDAGGNDREGLVVGDDVGFRYDGLQRAVGAAEAK